MDFLKENWIPLLIGLVAFWEVIVRLTPTTKDDTILEWIKQLIGLLPTNKKT